MKKFHHYIFMAGTFLRLNVQSALEYPTYLIGWLIANPLQFLFGVITVNVVVSKFQPLGGWGFEQLAFMYGLAIISHGLSVIFFVNQTWGMGYRITEGDFDRVLTRPLGILFQFFFSDIQLIGVTDLIPGLVIFVYGCFAAHFQFTAYHIFLLILTILGATLMRGGIYTVTGSLSFWFPRIGGLIDIHLGLFEIVGRYPLLIYPRPVQLFFTYIFPIAFLAFYPANQLLDKNTGFILPGNQCLWTFCIGLAVYLFGALVFRLGMRRYESAGS